MKRMKSDVDEVTIVGRLDFYEDLELGSNLVAVYTDDGEEYVISNRKMVRRLMPYAEDDIDITFVGTVDEDPYSHIKVLTVQSYEPSQKVQRSSRKTAVSVPLPKAGQDDFRGDEEDCEYIPDEDDRQDFDSDKLDDAGDEFGDEDLLDEDFADEDLDADLSDEERAKYANVLNDVLKGENKK